MQLPTALLATLRVGLGATALMTSACASTAAHDGPDAFPGLQPASKDPTPVMVTVPVAEPKPAPPIATPEPTPPANPAWECGPCGRG
jgi:hypothetical protein